MDKKIDQRAVDAELMEAVRRDRRRKRYAVLQKPPRRENAEGAPPATKKPA